MVKELFNYLEKEKVIRLVKNIVKDPFYNIILCMHGKVDFDTLMSW